MPEKEFWRHWELRYGEHQAVKTGDPFFSNMFYKLLQADIQMAESYSAEEDACAPCPIVSMMAADETRYVVVVVVVVVVVGFCVCMYIRYY